MNTEKEKTNFRKAELRALKSAILAASANTNCDIAIIAAIASAESGCRTYAHGDEGHSLGAFQLHDQGAGSTLSAEERHSPFVSAQRAAEYFMSSGDLTEWSLPDMFSCYNQGLGGWQQNGIINQAAVDRYMSYYAIFKSKGLNYIDTLFGEYHP